LADRRAPVAAGVALLLLVFLPPHALTPIRIVSKTATEIHLILHVTRPMSPPFRQDAAGKIHP
jgi:hypothetical protein